MKIFHRCGTSVALHLTQLCASQRHCVSRAPGTQPPAWGLRAILHNLYGIGAVITILSLFRDILESTGNLYICREIKGY